MSQPSFFYDYSKRDYLLPAGCKNLIDVINQPTLPKGWDKQPFEDIPTSGKMLREVMIPAQVSVRALAQLLNLKPFVIVACMIKDFETFKNMDEIIDFELAARIALQFGFKAQKMMF